MKKRGFTLVEILAIIVILGIILVIAVPSVNNIIKDSKNKTFANSVLTVVNDLKDQEVLNKIKLKKACFVNLKRVKLTDGELYGNGVVVVDQKNDKTSYTVYAESDNNTYINGKDSSEILNSLSNNKKFIYGYDLSNTELIINGISYFDCNDNNVKMSNKSFDLDSSLENKDLFESASDAFSDCYKIDNSGKLVSYNKTLCGSNLFISDNKLKKIDSSSLSNKNDIESVNLSGSVNLVSIDSDSFSTVSNIVFPDTSSTLTVQSNAFQCSNANNIKELSVSANVSLSNNFINDNCSIQNIIVNGGSISNSLFQNRGIENVTLNGAIGTVGEKAFYNNPIKKLLINGSVSEIQSEAFAHPSGVSNNSIDEITLTSNISFISPYSFSGKKLTTVNIINCDADKMDSFNEQFNEVGKKGNVELSSFNPNPDGSCGPYLKLK